MLQERSQPKQDSLSNSTSNSSNFSFVDTSPAVEGEGGTTLTSSALALLNATGEMLRWTPWMMYSMGKRLVGQDPKVQQYEDQRLADTMRGGPIQRYYRDALRRQRGDISPVLVPPAGEHLPILMALGGGTGASIGGTGRSAVDRDLLRRMHYQDKAVMFLVLVVYLVALAFSANLTYRQATNNSPVTYYADPRFHNYVMEGHELDVFLEAFNQAPKNISLQVAGFVPVPEENSSSVRWRGEDFQVAFTFSLDLSPWVVREIQMEGMRSSQTRTLHEGMLPEDRSSLNHTMVHDTNDLSYFELSKEVRWPDWEELATNIKHQIRQRGFTGVISVDKSEKEEVRVYKNRPWANFMHARATRVLCALSVVGWLIYVPYMWLRCKKVSLRSQFRVDCDISEYWNLIEDKLTPDGFQDGTAAAILLPQMINHDAPMAM
jgi:hypothetical protein